MTCIGCQHRNAIRFGTYGREKVQRYRCQSCNATFSDTRQDRFGNHYLSVEKTDTIISLMLEGVSLRAIGRLAGVDWGPVLSVIMTAGEKARHVFNSKVRQLRAHYLQLDELSCFIQKKEKRLRPDDPGEWGDTYTWIGLDSESKVIVAYLVGKRDAECANRFVRDLSNRVAGRCQVTSDGFRPYIGAVEEAWGADVDFAQLVKVYTSPDTSGPGWYGPPKVIETVATPIIGNADLSRVSTSHVERSNLTLRMHLRRFTRLTNAFSKKLAYLKAAVDVYMAWYNFCRVHQTLRITPAMEAGIADHVWSVSELLAA